MRWMAPAHGIWVPRCEGRQAFTSKREPSTMQITTIGLDLAKSIFQVHGVDAIGQVVVRKLLRRSQMLPFFAKLPSCLVGIEACGTSHHWARELIKLGHEVPPDATGLRQAVCEAWEDRRCRCGSSLRGGDAADNAV